MLLLPDRTMPTTEEIKALIAQCPTNTKHSTWTQVQKRALMNWQDNRNNPVLSSLFEQALPLQGAIRPLRYFLVCLYILVTGSALLSLLDPAERVSD